MKEKILKGAALVLGGLLLVDLIFLNWLALKKSAVSGENTGLEVWLSNPTPSPAPLSSSPTCPASCLEIISQSSSSGGKPVPTATPRPSYQAPQVKEFYVPLGSGSTTATSWTDIPGAEAYIDPANYGKIKSLTFEASLRVPSGSGRVYARLYNVNDKLGIFESEISGEGTDGIRVESSKLIFSSGNKLYRVQLKTTMGVEGDLDIGRIKILVE